MTEVSGLIRPLYDKTQKDKREKRHLIDKSKHRRDNHIDRRIIERPTIEQ